MLLLPYKLDVSLYRIPFVTVLVCLICVVTFAQQLTSHSTYRQRITRYCMQELDPNLRAILDNTGEDMAVGGCAGNLVAIRRADDRDAKIAALAQTVRNLRFYPDKAADLEYKTAKLSQGFADFDLSVPQQLTENLAYDPEQRSWSRMLTSTFAHADWEHLLGNIFFFFVFASCVESALGYGYFVLAILLMSVSTSLAYSVSVADTEALPTIGLSGVAMGMMAMILALLPRVQVWCIFWFLLFIRHFTLPLFVIALWYIGWNVFDLLHDDGSSHINYMAHVSGAATGLVLGLAFKLFHRQELEALTAEISH